MPSWQGRARALKVEISAIGLAYRDPRTPWGARIVAALLVAYAFSPIDLIPAQVMEESRQLARQQADQAKPLNWLGASLVLLLWLLAAALLVFLFWRWRLA
jgi:hypothetical protein